MEAARGIGSRLAAIGVNFRRLYGQGTPHDFSTHFMTFFSQ
jgi:hypothetical protein